MKTCGSWFLALFMVVRVLGMEYETEWLRYKQGGMRSPWNMKTAGSIPNNIDFGPSVYGAMSISTMRKTSKRIKGVCTVPQTNVDCKYDVIYF